ncbi:MAG: hypothetical protein AAFO28_05415, partial [Pseudomonadota bacterium]
MTTRSSAFSDRVTAASAAKAKPPAMLPVATRPSTRTALIVLIGFALLLAFTGGTSVATVLHNALLRPIAGLALVAALYWWPAREGNGGRALLVF